MIGVAGMIEMIDGTGAIGTAMRAAIGIGTGTGTSGIGATTTGMMMIAGLGIETTER